MKKVSHEVAKILDGIINIYFNKYIIYNNFLKIFYKSKEKKLIPL